MHNETGRACHVASEFSMEALHQDRVVELTESLFRLQRFAGLSK